MVGTIEATGGDSLIFSAAAVAVVAVFSAVQVATVRLFFRVAGHSHNGPGPVGGKLVLYFLPTSSPYGIVRLFVERA